MQKKEGIKNSKYQKNVDERKKTLAALNCDKVKS